MKPKPLSALNHFTVPVAISSSPLSQHATTRPRRTDREPIVPSPGTEPYPGHASSAAPAAAPPGRVRSLIAQVAGHLLSQPTRAPPWLPGTTAHRDPATRPPSLIPGLQISSRMVTKPACACAPEPPFWRRSLPSGVADRDVQIWVIWTRPPAWSASRQTLGRADVTDVLARPFSSPPS